MNRYLKKGAKFIIIGALPIIILGYAMQFSGVLPVLSNNVSFDAKAKFVNTKYNQKFDVIAIGSSMTLNNLNSKEVIAGLPKGKKYINLASWSSRMSNDLQLVKLYTPKFKNKVVIIVSSPIDFIEENLDLPSNLELKLYHTNKVPFYFFVKNFNPIDIWHRNDEIDSFTLVNNNFHDCLNFDNWGGVDFAIPTENIPNFRWNRAIDTAIIELQYDRLQELCKYLSLNGQKLVFIHSPLKAKDRNALRDSTFLENHINRTKSIIDEYGHFQLDFHNDPMFTDSLFADPAHLNYNGSELFTRKALKEIPFDILLN